MFAERPLRDLDESRSIVVHLKTGSLLSLILLTLLLIGASACAQRMTAAGPGDCFVCATWGARTFIDNDRKRREEIGHPTPAEPVRPPSKLPRARYVTGTCAPVAGDPSRFQLEDGSLWSFAERMPSLAGDVLIILRDGTSGTAYFATGAHPVQRVFGTAVMRSGSSGSVVEVIERGRTLRLNDGSLWEVDEADRQHTRTWPVPYPVLIQSDERRVWNLAAGKRFRATPKPQ